MQCIAFTVLPGFQMMTLAVSSVFEFANKEMGQPVYEVRLLSEKGGPVQSSMGVSVETRPFSITRTRSL